MDLNPYDGYRQSTWAMPEAYKGNNPFMTTMLIQLIEQEDLWPINYALPFRRDEANLEISWDTIEFSNHLLNVVPEEGTSRLVTQKVSSKREHMQRFGLAFLLEHGFMRTPQGQRSYVMNLKQIRNAVLETCYHNVIEAYLRCKTANQQWQARYGKGMTLQLKQLAEQNEVEEFGCIQKNEFGFDLVRLLCVREFVFVHQRLTLRARSRARSWTRASSARCAPSTTSSPTCGSSTRAPKCICPTSGRRTLPTF